MWTAYAFAALALISLPAALRSGSLIVIVAWIAQTFLQLVLLPVIMVGQNLQGRASESRSIETHDAVMEELRVVRQVAEELTSILRSLAGTSPEGSAGEDA